MKKIVLALFVAGCATNPTPRPLIIISRPPPIIIHNQSNVPANYGGGYYAPGRRTAKLPAPKLLKKEVK